MRHTKVSRRHWSSSLKLSTDDGMAALIRHRKHLSGPSVLFVVRAADAGCIAGGAQQGGGQIGRFEGLLYEAA